MSAVGVVITGGAADEKAHLGTVGGAQLAEVCAWRGTRNSSTADVLKRAEACGAYLHANAQREQTLYCIDALRDKLEDATQLLAEACLLGPDLEAPGAMDEVREGMELAFLDATQVCWRRPCPHAIDAPSSRRWRPENRRDAPRRTLESEKTSTPPRTVHHRWARRSSARRPSCTLCPRRRSRTLEH